MAQAKLKTQRIELVPLSDEHLEHEVELDADPKVMRLLGDGRPRSREEVEKDHRERLAMAEEAPGLGFWAGFVDGAFVGWWALEPPRRPDQGPAEGQAELGYRLLRRHWRQGLAKEGSRELLRHAFEDLGVARVALRADARNSRSIGAIRRLGAVPEGVLRSHRVAPDGSRQDTAYFSVLRDEWPTVRAGLLARLA